MLMLISTAIVLIYICLCSLAQLTSPFLHTYAHYLSGFLCSHAYTDLFCVSGVMFHFMQKVTTERGQREGEAVFPGAVPFRVYVFVFSGCVLSSVTLAAYTQHWDFGEQQKRVHSVHWEGWRCRPPSPCR